MDQITTQFASMAELVDFQMITNKHRAVVNPSECTLTGAFSEAEMELALNGFQARTVGGTISNRNSGQAYVCHV